MLLQEYIDQLLQYKDQEQLLTLDEFRSIFSSIYLQYPQLPQLDADSLDTLYHSIKNFNNNILDVQITYQFLIEELVPLSQQTHNQAPIQQKSPEQFQQQEQTLQQNQNNTLQENPEEDKIAQELQKNDSQILKNIAQNNQNLRDHIEKQYEQYTNEISFYQKSFENNSLKEQVVIEKFQILSQAMTKESIKITGQLVKYKEELEQKLVLVDSEREILQKKQELQLKEFSEKLQNQQHESSDNQQYYQKENEQLKQQLKPLQEKQFHFSDLETQLALKERQLQQQNKEIEQHKEELKSLDSKNKLLIEQNNLENQTKDILKDNQKLESEKIRLQQHNNSLEQKIIELEQQNLQLQQQQQQQNIQQENQQQTQCNGFEAYKSKIGEEVISNQNNLLTSIINSGNEGVFDAQFQQFYQAPPSTFNVQNLVQIDCQPETTLLLKQHSSTEKIDYDSTPQPKDLSEIKFDVPSKYDHIKPSQNVQKVEEKHKNNYFYISPYTESHQYNRKNDATYVHEFLKKIQENNTTTTASNSDKNSSDSGSNFSSFQEQQPTSTRTVSNTVVDNQESMPEQSLPNLKNRAASENLNNQKQQQKEKKITNFDLLDVQYNNSIISKISKLSIEFKQGQIFSDKGCLYQGSTRLHVWIIINHKYIYVINPQKDKVVVFKSLQLMKAVKIVMDSSTFTQIEFKQNDKDNMLIENFRQSALIEFLKTIYKKNYKVDLQVGFQKQFAGNHKIMHNVYIYNNIAYSGHLEKRNKTLVVNKIDSKFVILCDLGLLVFDKPGGRTCDYVAITSESQIDTLATTHYQSHRRYGFEVHNNYQNLHSTFYAACKEEEQNWISRLKEYQQYRKIQNKNLNKRHKEVYKIESQI